MSFPPLAEGAPDSPGETVVAEQPSREAFEPSPERDDAGAPPRHYAPTPTAAPTIGAVLPAPPPQLAAMTCHRQASVSLDGLFIGPYHVAAGSLAGSAHLASGTPRQDAYDFIATGSNRLVIAVADGMGSRRHSQVGARAFCEGICLAAEANPDEAAINYLHYANDYVLKVCRDRQMPPNDVSFVAAIAVFDGAKCEILRIGDVSAFALTGDHFTELFADTGGHLNIVATSLPTQPPPSPESFCGHGLTRVALCTDGLANDIRHSAQVRAWLQKNWMQLTDAYGMAEALRFHRRGSHDDRTAVLVSVQPGGPD